MTRTGRQAAARPHEVGADQRSARRFTLLLRAGKLVSPMGEYLCILRDVSSTGIKARLFHELPAAETYTLELGNGDRYLLAPVWQREGHAGFRFADGPIDVHVLMDEAASFPKRSIRLKLDLPVMVAAAGASRRLGTLRDLSQQGALIELAPDLALGQQVRIEAPGLPLRHARVCWRRGGAHGLVFQQGFRLDELAVLAHRLQARSALVAAGTSAGHRPAALTGD